MDDILRVRSLKKTNLKTHIVTMESFCKSIGYEYVIDNGQRIIKSSIPIKNSYNYEVYVSRIPSTLTEFDMFNLFSKAGIISELRMMYNFENVHRGYAYIKFFDSSSAKRALLLNNIFVTKTNTIKVCKSINNCCLYFAKIPKQIKRDEFEKELSKIVFGIEDVILPTDVNDQNFNRGYAFVQFPNHKLAAIANKMLSFKSFKLNGIGILVDWSRPHMEFDEEYMKQVTRLYLCNLPLSATNWDIRRHIVNLTKKYAAITRVFKMKDFCFVHFTERRFAEQALELLQGTRISDRMVRVKWANPLSCRVDYLDYNWICKSYRSIPYKMKKMTLEEEQKSD